MSVTFSNPQLTIFNGSGSTIGSGANACTSNTVCQLTPSASPLTLAFSAAPFPITIGAAPVAFKLDIHLNTVIQADLTLNLAASSGVTVSQLATPPSGAPISGLGNLIGTVQSVNSVTCALSPSCPSSFDDFTLQTGDGRTFTIDVNSSTTYDYPGSVCSNDSFSCLAAGQIVRVRVSLQTGGSLLASSVTYVQPAGQTVVEGNILGLSFPATYPSGNAVMELIPQQGPPPPSTASALPPFGQPVSVTVPPAGVTYAIDSGSFILPNGLSFTQAADLMVGQQVSVVVVPGSVTTASGSTSSTSIPGPAATTFTTNSITLEPSQLTGMVNGVFPIDASALSFVVSTFPNYFVPPPAASGAPPTPAPINITVQATSATTFANLTPDSISGLAAGDVVSIRGWLFPYGAIPLVCKGVGGCAPVGVIAAEAVVGRPGPTPLF